MRYRFYQYPRGVNRGWGIVNEDMPNDKLFIMGVYSINGLSPTLTQFTGGGRQHKILINMEDKKDVLVDFQGKKVAIRKLTQWECLRLMGVPEDKINLAKQSGIKKTNIYKMAGNSIVVHQLAAIFENIFYPPQQSNKQLKLF